LSVSRILLLDDEQSVLDAYQRALRRRFHLDVADGARAGLTKILTAEPYAVVISDMMLPGVTGLEILRRLKEFSPHSVGILLTGFGDYNMAVEAMNQGIVYRFLTKPCPVEKLMRAIDDALEFHRLQTNRGEHRKDQLEPALRIVSRQLALQRQSTYGRKLFFGRLMREICESLKLPDPEDFELAATFVELAWCSASCQTLQALHGHVPGDEGLPSALLDCERTLLESLSAVSGFQLLSEMLMQPNLPWKECVPCDTLLTCRRTLAGGHLLHLAREFAQGYLQTNSAVGALIRIKARREHYHPQAVAALTDLSQVWLVKPA